MAEYTLKIKKIKTPTDANWVTTIPTEYTNIKGRVYNIVKVEDGGKSKYDKNGYWKATADLMGLINPFTNPISNKPVTETKIELVYKDTYGWEEGSSEKMYFDFLADQCVKKMQTRYKELYGVDIDLSYTKAVEEKKVDDIPPTELYLKYISHVDGSNTSRSQLPQGGVTKVTFEVYEKSGTGADEKTTLLGKIDDLLKFEVDPLTKKISVLLSEINNVQIVNSKIDDWLNKNIDKLPKDTKYGLYEYPDEKKEIKTKEQIELDETAWEFPPLVIHGEFTFDVQEENLFKGVIFPFKVLEIIGVGEIKETPIPEQVDETIDEEIDEEYLEEESTALEEAIFVISADREDIIINTEQLNAIKNNDPENPNPDLLTNEKYPVSNDTDGNIKEIIKAAKNAGITNKFVIAAILAICKKECGLIPQNEASYRNTAASKYTAGKLTGGIKKIFSKFRSYSDAEVDVIKKNDKKFFDIVYGGKYGNAADEGYKYRGRGFNQITFKGSDKNPMSGYLKFKVLTGLDLVSDPDLLNKIDVAAKCLIEYMKSNLSKANNDIKGKYNFTDINSFKNLEDATGAIYHANAGFGTSYSAIISDPTGGRKKAFNYVGPLYNTYLK